MFRAMFLFVCAMLFLAALAFGASLPLWLNTWGF